MLSAALHNPPTDLTAPHTASVIFTVVCSVIFVGALGWSLWRASKGDTLAIFLILGGLVACMVEPMLDNLGLLWFAEDNVAIVFKEFQRSIPLYVLLGYGFFFGAEAFVAYYGLREGHGARFLWGLYVFAWFFDLALESTGHLTGLYKYYGPQPFNIWGVPLWWMFINPVLPIVAGVLFYGLGDVLRGIRGALAVVLLPLTYGAVYGGTSWPIFVALNSEVSTFVIYLAALVTIANALILTRIAIGAADWLAGRSKPAPATPP